MDVIDPMYNLLKCTLRIEILNDNLDFLGSGTGFIIGHDISDTKIEYFIVTNRHVFEVAKNIKVAFSLKDKDGNFISGNSHETIIPVEINKNVKFHKDASIDLAMMKITDMHFQGAYDEGTKLFYSYLSTNTIPAFWCNFFTMEEIIMIGYPNGLWDAHNNLPIIRRGVTASHPLYDFNGKKEFLIDAACFPGSSGSPVFCIKHQSVHDWENDVWNNETRINLMGILHSGPVSYSEGMVLNTLENLTSGDRTRTKTMLNLGFVLKSDLLLDLLPDALTL